METKFILKDKNSKNPTLIYLFIFYQFKRYKYSTSITVLPELWNAKKQRFIVTVKNQIAIDCNQKLENLSATALKIVYNFENDERELTTDVFKAEMDIKFRPHKTIEKVLFVESMLAWFEILAQKRGRREMTSKHSCVRFIKECYPNWEQLTFDDIDIQFYAKLNEFLIMHKEFKLNYIANLTRDLKQFMKYSQEQGLHKNMDYQSFQKIHEEADTISLSEEELTKVMKVSLPKSYEIIRDGFIIQCYTGLRHSDLIRLEQSNVVDGLIVIRTQKTDKVIAVPIHPEVKRIIAKYNGFPKIYTNQVMNKALKEICEGAKLNRMVSTRSMVKNEKVTTESSVWQLVSTHTGRRTALTLMYKKGIDLLSLTKISGHTTVKQLQTYLKIDSLESAETLKFNKFFIGTN